MVNIGLLSKSCGNVQLRWFFFNTIDYLKTDDDYFVSALEESFNNTYSAGVPLCILLHNIHVAWYKYDKVKHSYK